GRACTASPDSSFCAADRQRQLQDDTHESLFPATGTRGRPRENQDGRIAGAKRPGWREAACPGGQRALEDVAAQILILHKLAEVGIDVASVDGQRALAVACV